MEKDKISLAIFDFDGTLTRGHLWAGIAKHHKTKHVKRMTFLAYFLQHLPLWLATKVRLYSEEKNRVKWGEDLPILLKGFTVDEAKEVFKWVADNYFMPLMRDDVLSHLKRHRSEGRKVVLLSGTFDDFLKVIGQRLGVEFTIGTMLEKKNGIYTGRIIPPLCIGDNKARLLTEFIRDKKLNVDFKQSTAYADSVHDVSVLHMTGYPVATYPDKELFRIARERQWAILDHTDK